MDKFPVTVDMDQSISLDDDILEPDPEDQLGMDSLVPGTLVHSPTTDTLDSVNLEASIMEDPGSHTSSVEDLNLDLETAKTTDDTNAPIKDEGELEGIVIDFNKKETDDVNSGDMVLTTDMVKETQTDNRAAEGLIVDDKQPQLSNYFGNEEEDNFFDTLSSEKIGVVTETQGIDNNIADSFGLSLPVETVETNDSPSVDSNIACNLEIDQKDSNVEVSLLDSKQTGMDTVNTDENISQELTVAPESVDFEPGEMSKITDMADDILDEDEFQSFTAEGNEFNPVTGEGIPISPSHGYPEPVPPFSYSSPDSAVQPPPGPTSITLTNSGQTIEASAISGQLSPLTTPVHQPSISMGAPSPQGGNMSPPADSVLGSPGIQTTTSPGIASAFQPFHTEADDPFTASLNVSDTDRRYDAWIPSDATRHILISMATSPTGTIVTTPEQLCTPSLMLDTPQGDPVRELVYKFMGEHEAAKRQTLTADNVAQDLDGLRQLMRAECLRAAVDLTGRLLTQAGQGITPAGETIKHTPQTIQLWFCRLSLLMKLRQYSLAESECQAFKTMDTPDIYYDFYQHAYPGKRGSMVPFGMRLIHAELPHYLGRTQEALDRLYYVLAITQKIISNLESYVAEDGSMMELESASRQASKELWRKRECQVLYIIGNTLLSIKDYDTGISILYILIEKDKGNKSYLLSGIGRVYLQMGSLEMAGSYFKQVEEIEGDSSCRINVNRGLMALCSHDFNEAYGHLKLAVDQEPDNAMVVNNLAVCSLYLGKLKDALLTLEGLVHRSPQTHLHEGVLFNLCTLYELESSHALNKKQVLLDMVSQNKGDSFNAACLKMA